MIKFYIGAKELFESNMEGSGTVDIIIEPVKVFHASVYERIKR